MTTVPPVWIDEPDPVYRRGLVTCLEENGVSLAGESVGFAPRPDSGRLGILVFDMGGPGLRQAVRLVRGAPARLVGVAATLDDRSVTAAVEAGVSGLLLRPELTPEGFMSCLRSAAAGNVSLPPVLVKRLLGVVPSGAAAHGGDLRERELEVLSLLADGGDTREIAAELSYSERTVKNIVQAILLKTGGRTRAHAVALATRQGVI